MKQSHSYFKAHRSLLGLVATALISSAVVSGCGGGGGGGSDSADATQDGNYGEGVIALSWRAPSERENGDALALAEMGGYRVYWGPSDNPTQDSVTIDDPYVTTYELDGVPPGTYQVAVTAIDTSGLESSLSNSVTKSVY